MSVFKKNELFLLEEIVKKNFASKYKESVLGIFWSILKPLMIMIVFTIIFSTLFKRIGNFPVYFLSGKCIYDFFTGAITVSLTSLKGNKNILQKTSVPKHIFILGSVFSEFLNFIISLLLLVVIMIVTHAPFYFSVMPFAIVPIISVLIMVSGFGLMLSIFSVYYTDIQHLWGVVSLILMYASAIFYPMSIVPEPYYDYMILNPLTWVIDLFRAVIYEGVVPQMHTMINSLLLSTIILVIGIIIFKKYEKKVTMRL